MIIRLLKILVTISILSACQINSSEDRLNNSARPQPTIKQSNLPANPIFQNVLPKLKAKTQIDPVLPNYLPEYKSDPPLHAILTNASDRSYQIVLGYTPDCTGQNACRLGNIEATTADSSSLQGEETVTLDNGTKAYFTDAVCNAYCTDSTLTWKQDSVVHTVGIKAGKIETLVKIAESM